jgi:hypothetical protein
MKSIDFNSMVKGISPIVISGVFLLFFPLLAQGLDIPLISTQVSTINLPQTGQTNCYDQIGTEINCSGTGQDGEIRAGVEWPNPRFTITYCDTTGPCADQNSDCDDDPSTDVITDNLTGLMWARDGNLLNGRRGWQGTLNYIASLNKSGGPCGFTDWRLPNTNELESLVNTGINPAAAWLISQGFINFMARVYWSSTSRPSDTRFAEVIDFANGLMNSTIKPYATYFCLVRSEQSLSSYPSGIWKTGQTLCYDLLGSEINCLGTGQDGETQAGIDWPNPRFTDNSNGIVTDNLTGLEWTKDANAPGPTSCNSKTSKTWQQALDYVECLNTTYYLGFNDWRLPNKNELFSLIDRSHDDPSLPAGHPFLDVKSLDYWSSSTHLGDRRYALTIFLGYGFPTWAEKWSDSFVWPVRGGVILEYVSTPDLTSGPTSATTGTSYNYSTGGSTSNFGHTVEYQFDWKGDGSDLSSWGSSTQSKTWTTASTYSVRARARCTIDTSIVSSWSGTLSVTISVPETVSTPSVLSGPTSGTVGTSYSYTTGGSTSSFGHTVEYQFDWKGDGSNLSSWGSATQSKTWATAGTYNVRARARCATHTSVVSEWSRTLSVNITSNPILTVLKSGTGSGTVTSSPAGINCGDDCSETYTKVQEVKLTAKADANSTFTGWSGGGCSGTKTCTVTVDSEITVTASFALKTPDISVAQTSLDFGSVKVEKKVTKTLKITNNGTGDLVVALSVLDRTDFSIQGSSSVIIKAKKSYTMKILFRPTSGGLKTATLEVNSNDLDSPSIDISLSGTGQ